MYHIGIVRTALVAFLCGIPAASIEASPVIVAGNGGDLVATVATAPTGSVIEIRSNQTFVGTLSWANKYLTIQAGAGFKPTIKGDPGQAALISIDGNATTGGEFKGLRFYGTSVAGSVYLSTTSTRFSTVKFIDNEFFHALLIGGTGEYQFAGSFERNRFLSGVHVGGTGNSKHDSEFRDNYFASRVTMSGTGMTTNNMLLERNRIAGSFYFGGISEANLSLVAANNVFSYSSSRPYGIGLEIQGADWSSNQAHFVNNTVVGFAEGIQVKGNVRATFENMLLKNEDDLEFQGSMASIAHSLISDGTYANIDGNIAGEPDFGPLWQLSPGSPGIDAGNNAAIALHKVDIEHKARIVDGDFDGIARVDVGAFETIPEPQSACLMGCALLMRGVLGRPRVRRSDRE
ncbi:MAG: hypothetical protein C0485_15425 [Pirellula sp.]|nr:hypothetical protein [Pirellula sp.]